jgi:phosphoribosyl 1,2-cyclic phosphodiesterase|tara:strand:- start:18988 stop:19815 length:828 start_codon:yes stop_codon:yes gene_type:complete
LNKTIIRFWGCRGSFPSFDENKVIYGGDTSCIEVRTSDNQLIILDMGTGLRKLGQKIVNDSSYPKDINIFLSHHHLDHIHGFVMFAPLFNPEYNITIHSRLSRGKNFKEILETFLQPEVWPVMLDDLPASLKFNTIDDSSVEINNTVKVSNSLHAHPNKAYSIKLDVAGKIITYVTDCEHPKKNLNQNVVNFASDSDILIHDAQYTLEDLEAHSGWGHSSWKEAVDVAIQSNSKKLVLFHHSPDYDDNQIKDIEKKAQMNFPDVVAAKQCMKIEI